MNLAAAITEVKARGGSYLSDSRLTTFLNSAKNDLEDTYPWPWLETTTTGTAPLTLSDLKYILYVVNTSNNEQVYGVDPRDVVNENPTIGRTGTPVWWWLDGTETLKLYPTNSSASLSVRYVKYSPELALDADEPLIPARYHPLWVDLAMVQVYKDSDDFEQAAALLGECDRRMAQMFEVFVTRNHQNPMVQQITHGSEDW